MAFRFAHKAGYRKYSQRRVFNIAPTSAITGLMSTFALNRVASYIVIPKQALSYAVPQEPLSCHVSSPPFLEYYQAVKLRRIHAPPILISYFLAVALRTFDAPEKIKKYDRDMVIILRQQFGNIFTIRVW